MVDISHFEWLNVLKLVRKGDFSHLAKWLREDSPLDVDRKRELASALERRGPGRPKYDELEMLSTPSGRREVRMKAAAGEYRRRATALREVGKLRGRADELCRQIAEEYSVDADVLRNRINRGR